MAHRWGNKSRHERGYSTAWTKLRLVIIARDLGLCQECKRQGRVTPFRYVDHIIPKAEGGTDDETNLECQCSEHGESKTLAEAARAQGRTVKAKPAFTKDGRAVWPE